MNLFPDSKNTNMDNPRASVHDFVLEPEPAWIYEKVKIFTDGSCANNPGAGGWGAIIRHSDGREEEIYGSEKHTTNNRMELSAAMHALRHLQVPARVIVVTDSKYLRDGMSKWLSSWKSRNWRAANGKPVKNKSLWEYLDRLSQWHRVSWQWIEAHSGHEENERADALARKGTQEAQRQKQ